MFKSAYPVPVICPNMAGKKSFEQFPVNIKLKRYSRGKAGSEKKRSEV